MIMEEAKQTDEQKERKFGVLGQYVTAIAKPHQYEKFLHLTTGRVAFFMIIFMMITTFVSQFLRVPLSELFGDKSVVNQYRKGLKESLDEFVPEFILKDGVLTLLSDPVRINEEDNRLIVVNDTIHSFRTYETSGYADLYKEIILASRTNIVMYNNGIESLNITYEDWLSENDLESLDKEALYARLDKNASRVVYRQALVFTIMALFMNLFTYLFASLILMVILKMMMNIWRFALSYTDLFKMAVYSTVSFWTVNALLNLYGIGIPYAFFVSMIVGFIYVWIATNFLKKSGYDGGIIEKRNVKEYVAAKKSGKSDIYKKAMINTAGLYSPPKRPAPAQAKSENAPAKEEPSVRGSEETNSDAKESDMSGTGR